MNNELIKKTFEEMKKKLPKAVKCPDEDDILRFAEGVMDEKEAEKIKQHFLVCTKCSDDYVSLFATLDKATSFSEGELFPKVSSEQIKQVCDMVRDRKKNIHKRSAETILERVTQSVRDFFTSGWLAQPIPIAIKSGVAILVVLFIFVFIYYPNQMEYHNVSQEFSKVGVAPPTKSLEGLEDIDEKPAPEEKRFDQKARSPILKKSPGEKRFDQKTRSPILKKSPGEKRITNYYKKGNHYFQKEDYSKAEAVWKECLDIDPNHEPSKKGLAHIKTKIDEHYQNGLNYFQEQNLSLAIREWEKVAKYDPDFENVSQYLKRAYKMQERSETLEKSKP